MLAQQAFHQLSYLSQTPCHILTIQSLSFSYLLISQLCGPIHRQFYNLNTAMATIVPESFHTSVCANIILLIQEHLRTPLPPQICSVPPQLGSHGLPLHQSPDLKAQHSLRVIHTLLSL